MDHAPRRWTRIQCKDLEAQTRGRTRDMRVNTKKTGKMHQKCIAKFFTATTVLTILASTKTAGRAISGLRRPTEKVHTNIEIKYARPNKKLTLFIKN